MSKEIQTNGITHHAGRRGMNNCEEHDPVGGRTLNFNYQICLRSSYASVKIVMPHSSRKKVEK